MFSASQELQEVDAVRQARLESQQCRFQLAQAHNELLHKQALLEELQQQVSAMAAAQSSTQAAAAAAQPQVPCCSADELQEARLQAADYKCQLQLTELELAKQLDALQELQWQLDCVVLQLGLQPPMRDSSNSGGGGGESGEDVPAVGQAAARAAAPPAPPAVDHLLLLNKVEELCMAQVQLGDYQRRLAHTEAELAAARSQFVTLQQQQQQCRRREDAEREHELGDTGQIGAGEKLLVGELLQENEQLRQRLAESEEQYCSLERDYEVELLIKAESAEQTYAAPAASDISAISRLPQPGYGQFAQHRCAKQLGRQVAPAEQVPMGSHQGRAAAAGAASHKTSCGSGAVEHIARQRLEFRLQEKDKQLGKLRGVVQELEGKLIDAFKRQADLVMKDSSWREQEAQDRRIALLQVERDQLAFAAQAAQAETEAARKEAAVQRQLAKRLQQQVAAAAGGAGQEGAGGSTQMVELLQKRIKVLEAQNIKLRIQAKSSKEEAERAAAAPVAATAAAPTARGQRGRSSSGGNVDDIAVGGVAPLGDAEGAAGSGAAAENDAPNRSAPAGDGGNGAGGNNLLDDVVLKWEADKRLQKKVEALQAKLQDKTTALVSAQAAGRRAEEQAQQLQAQLEQCQATKRVLQGQLTQAEQRSAPGAMVPSGKCQELLQALEQLQQRYDDLERQHAALQHRVPPSALASSKDGASAEAVLCMMGRCASQAGSVPAGEGDSLTAAIGSAARSSSMEPMRASSSKAYRATDYGDGSSSGNGGSAVPRAAPTDLQAQLLEKDVQLFDARLQRDQAVAEAERQRHHLHDLLDCLSPHPQDDAAAAAISEAREAAGLPVACVPAGEKQTGLAVSGGSSTKVAGKQNGGRGVGGSSTARGGAATGRRQQPSGREQELLDTIALLKNALERTKKGLESGVPSSKYMAAVERAKQLKAQCQQLEAQVAEAAKVREELARLQQQLGAMHGTASALRSQLKEARGKQEEAASAREHLLQAQVSELERVLRERDAQMTALNENMQQVDEEVRVMVAEGLRPADLVQELLVLRPRVRELEERNRRLAAELAACDDEQFARELEALQAEHALLVQQCARWEGEVRRLCSGHGEPLPLGLAG